MNSSQFNTVNEAEVLDELSIAQGLGAVGRGIGAVASVPQGIGRAIKQGYKSGVKAIGGDGGEPQAAAQAPAAGTPAPQSAAPAGAQTGGGGAADTSGLEAQLKQAEQTVASLKSQLQAAKQQGGGASTQQASTQSAAQTQAAPAEKKAAGGGVAGAFKDAEAAMKAGVGMGTNGQSLMQTGKKSDDSVSIKDAHGQEHSYKKVGQQWFDKDNKPVNAAQAAMLDKQAQQQSALGKDTTKPAAAQEPVKIGGQTLDPNNPADKKIIDQVQAQQGGGQQPAAGAQQTQPAAQGGEQQPAGGNKVDWNDKSNPVVQKRRERADAIQNGTNPDTGEQLAPDQIPVQLKAEMDKYKAGKFDPATGQPSPDNAAPAQQPAAQSPEEIRKAKQATAGKAAQDQMAANPAPAQQPAAPTPDQVRQQKQGAATKVAQDQMAANPAPAQQPAAVWKNNRAPAGTPAATSPQAAAATAQQAAPNDVMARMAKQLAPTEPAAAPNFGQQQPGYASVKMNAPTANVPQQPAAQPTAGAKAVPQLSPAQRKTAKADYKKSQAAQPASMNNTVASSTGGGFQNYKKAAADKGVTVEESVIDFSAILARKIKL